MDRRIQGEEKESDEGEEIIDTIESTVSFHVDIRAYLLGGSSR